MQSLNTVTDRFSLVEKIRKHTPQNNRNYVIQSVRDTFNSPETKSVSRWVRCMVITVMVAGRCTITKRKA